MSQFAVTPWHWALLAAVAVVLVLMLCAAFVALLTDQPSSADLHVVHVPAGSVFLRGQEVEPVEVEYFGLPMGPTGPPIHVAVVERRPPFDWMLDDPELTLLRGYDRKALRVPDTLALPTEDEEVRGA